MKPRRVLYCNCSHARVVPPAVKSEVLRQLVDSGTAFDAVADLCEMSARNDPSLKRLATSDGDIRIAACFPRAVKWIFHAAGAPLPAENVTILNMRSASAAQTVAGLLDDGAARDAEREERA